MANRLWTSALRRSPGGAFRAGVRSCAAQHNAEIDAIAPRPMPPTFDNTIAALDASGRRCRRIDHLFHNLCGSETSRELQAVEREMSPRLAAHDSAIYLNAALFARIDAVHARRDTLGLGAEERRLLERVHLDFVLAGARLSAGAEARYAAIVERLATCTTQFSQNVLADEAELAAACSTDERDLAGLPERRARGGARGGAASAAGADALGITLSRSLIVPFLTFSDRRDLREQAFKRGRRAANTTARTTTARSRARSWRCATSRRRCTATRTTPTTRSSTGWPARPPRSRACSSRSGTPAKAARRRGARCARGDGRVARRGRTRSSRGTGATTRRKCARRATTSTTRCSSPTSRWSACSRRRSTARAGSSASASSRGPTLQAYHPDVRVFEVRGADDRVIGVFLRDNFARPSKRGGAWMSAYRKQSRDRRRCAADHRQQQQFRQGRQRASRRCCRPTTCARCSTSSVTACTACCRR